jgi:gliding motility-associated-like protein
MKFLSISLFFLFSLFLRGQGTWTPIASLPDSGRFASTSFAIGNKGYVFGGEVDLSTNKLTADVWEYTPSTNSWLAKAPFGGGPRYGSSSFVIGTKAYVMGGVTVINGPFKDLWEYDSVSNTWTRKADFPGVARYDAVAFVIGNKGYVGTGSAGGPPYLNDFYAYDPGTDSWSVIASLPSTKRSGAISFTYNNIGYVGIGQYQSTPPYLNDLWAYDPFTNSWTQKADFIGNGKNDCDIFAICDRFFVGTGLNDSFNETKDFSSYDPITDSWSPVTNFPGNQRWFSVAFSIGGTGYFGTGRTWSNTFNDFYSFTYNTQVITPIDTSICAGTSITLNSTPATSYQWSGGSNATTQSITVSPLIDTKYYINVSNGSCPGFDSITVKVVPKPSANITGDTIICLGESTVLTASGGIAYQWAGGAVAYTPDITVFPNTDTKYYVTVTSATCNAIDSITVKVNTPPFTSVSNDTIVCSGAPVILTASGGIFYQWSGGSNATTQSITVNPNIQTIYYVTASDNFCTGNKVQTIVDIHNPIPIDAGADITINLGESTDLNVTGGSSNSYTWYPAINISCSNCPNPKASPDVTTTYYVSSIDVNGCESLDSVVVNVENNCTELYIPNTFTPDGDGLNDVFTISSACLKNIDLKIFNRWGELIFESKSISDPWTGIYNGNYVQDGVYVYSIKATFINGEIRNKTGGITVLK